MLCLCLDGSVLVIGPQADGLTEPLSLYLAQFHQNYAACWHATLLTCYTHMHTQVAMSWLILTHIRWKNNSTEQILTLKFVIQRGLPINKPTLIDLNIIMHHNVIQFPPELIRLINNCLTQFLQIWNLTALGLAILPNKLMVHMNMCVCVCTGYCLYHTHRSM